MSAGEAPDTVELDFFVSPTEGFRQATVRAESLKRATLERQTRVYVLDDGSGEWLPCRLAETGTVDSSTLDREQFPDAPGEGMVFVVAYPGRVERAVRRENVHPRWGKPISSPVAWLASKAHDGPFLYTRRVAVIRELVHQRAMFEGMTSLASASVELFKHQFDAVRTVLHDPIMRYVLADEVGLGKTIEAGIIIRQHVLDDPNHARVLVLVPHHLVGQWKDELHGLLSLSGPYERSVEVRSVAEAHWATEVHGRSPSMLVVDEAHQAARLAGEDSKSAQARYEALAALAHKAAHVLLLSATPVIRNEAGFLAMLHLLDPAVYRLENLAPFRRLIATSQEFGGIVALLRPRQNAALLRRALRQLNELTAGEGLIGELAARVEELLEEDRASTVREEAISRLRLHIQEVYRVHQRLVRTSRDDPRAGDYLPAGRVLESETYDNALRLSAFEYLEDWRFGVLDACEEEGRAAPRRLFAEWVDAALVHPRELKSSLSERLEQLQRGSAVSLFEGEEALLLAAVTELGDEDPAHSSILSRVVSQKVRGIDKKAIVFMSTSRSAEHLHQELTRKLGARVARVSGKEVDSAQRFVDDPGLTVLIVEQDGEEGLNLQRANTVVIHADLPLSPIRVEQRLGRIDRLRSKSPRVLSLVPHSTKGYEGAAFRLLQSSGVFERSVAPLQYLLNEIIQSVRERLLDAGVEAVEDVLRNMVDPDHDFSLDAEAKRGARLRILDEMERSDEPSSAYQHLEDYEYGHGASRFAAAVQAWLGEGCLGLKRLGEDKQIQFAFSERSSLVTKSQFIEHFLPALNRGLARPVTRPVVFDRSEASRLRKPIARVGSLLIESVERQARVEERGMAYAIWRECPALRRGLEPSVFFRFDFLIEASVQRNDPATRRIADSILPPRLEAVWINSNLVEEEDESLLRILRADPKSGALGTIDHTLVAGTSWTCADRFLASPWVDLCMAAEEVAIEAIRGRASILEAVNIAVEAVRARFARTETILKARGARLSGADSARIGAALQQEQVMASDLEVAVSDPGRVLQFAGAVFLSREALPVIEQAE